MTTEPRPAHGRDSPRGSARAGAGPASGSRGILLRTAGIAVVAALLTAGLGFALNGSPGGLGALVGGLLVVLVFGTGSLAVDLMARRSATEALLTAMTTYLGQVIVLVTALVLLSRGGLVGDELSRGWLAGGVVAVALAWSVAQIWVTRRARIPLYDLPGHGG
jgi:ATP synthase protein I